MGQSAAIAPVRGAIAKSGKLLSHLPAHRCNALPECRGGFATTPSAGGVGVGPGDGDIGEGTGAETEAEVPGVAAVELEPATCCGRTGMGATGGGDEIVLAVTVGANQALASRMDKPAATVTACALALLLFTGQRAAVDAA
jgi:hypothetical protein